MAKILPHTEMKREFSVWTQELERVAQAGLKQEIA